MWWKRNNMEDLLTLYSGEAMCKADATEKNGYNENFIQLAGTIIRLGQLQTMMPVVYQFESQKCLTHALCKDQTVH